MTKNKKNMLITGVSGLLGNNLAYFFKDKYSVTGLYNSHAVEIEGIDINKCDLSDPDQTKVIISKYEPQIIIHCAALTDLDHCEKDKNTAKKVNVFATRNIVENIAKKDVKFVYISTDAVYNGIKGNFSEEDNISPKNFYGQSKYEGELESLKIRHSLILRTNFFGWNIQNKNSLGEWILKALKGKKPINGFKDAYFSSIYTMELARLIDIAIKKNITGIYNCGSINSCSKYDFCLRIADFFGFDRGLVTSISIDDFNFNTNRGKNLSLNVHKLQKHLDVKIKTIDGSIQSFYYDYTRGFPDKIKGYLR